MRHRQCVLKRMTPHGYWVIRRPLHPRATRFGWVLEHILIAEQMYGGPLPPGAVVHHVDGTRHNNRESNLMICSNQGEHMRLHGWDRRRRRSAQMELWPEIHLCPRAFVQMLRAGRGGAASL